jgi:hypothetical protein
MLPVPTLINSGVVWPSRDQLPSYESASLQATLQFTIATRADAGRLRRLVADDQLLAQQGIIAMADWIYLRQPYQSVIAGPLQSGPSAPTPTLSRSRRPSAPRRPLSWASAPPEW